MFAIIKNKLLLLKCQNEAQNRYHTIIKVDIQAIIKKSRKGPRAFQEKL